jgi:phenylacetate-CoA ligase
MHCLDNKNMNVIPAIETQPREVIRRFQEEKLAIALDYLATYSPFYKRLLKKNRIDIRKIRKLEDLQTVPFSGKADLQQFNDDFVCVPKDKIIDYITPAGTLGEPVTFAMTDADLDRLAYNEKISFQCAGARPGDVFQLMTTIDKRFMAGLAYFLGIRQLGAGIVRVGNGIPELQWDTIARIRPNSIIVVPSFIPKIIQYAENHGIDYKNASVKKAVCIGENVRRHDFSLNLLGQRIKDLWDIELYSTYASTEMATSFTECKYGCGGHHHPELILCELTDEDGSPVREGETGELVITTLGVEGMPLLRFKTGDLASFHYEPCRCGRTTMRISPIVGRKNHMVKYKGTSLYPPAIFDVLDHTSYIEDYVMMVSDNDFGNDRIVIKAGIGAMPPFDVTKDLKDRFRARIRVAPEIEICPVDEIRKIIISDKNRKPVKFIDNRKKTDYHAE